MALKETTKSLFKPKIFIIATILIFLTSIIIMYEYSDFDEYTLPYCMPSQNSHLHQEIAINYTNQNYPNYKVGNTNIGYDDCDNGNIIHSMYEVYENETLVGHIIVHGFTDKPEFIEKKYY